MRLVPYSDDRVSAPEAGLAPGKSEEEEAGMAYRQADAEEGPQGRYSNNWLEGWLMLALTGDKHWVALVDIDLKRAHLAYP